MSFIFKHDLSGCATIARRLSLMSAAVLLHLAPEAMAQLTINFETEPLLALQPNNFVAAGAVQTYSSPGIYTLSGGVALGSPGFLASFPTHGSAQNLYGTTDIADVSLLSTMTLDIDPSYLAISVLGLLFNGQTIPEDYTVSAFSGVTLVGSQTSTVLANTDVNGFFSFSLSSVVASPITRVTITTPNAQGNGWDFLVDDLILTPGQPVPESSALLLTPVVALILARQFRGRRTEKTVS